MALPNLLFGLVIALILGALFHAFRGGSGWRLLLYLGISIFGFVLGQWLGTRFGWALYPFGALDIGFGLLGGILCLAIGDWFIGIGTNHKSGV